MPIGPGEMLSHYRLVERLGEGGMGVVWKAVDTRLNRTVAIKILPAALAADPERRLRFQREAQAAAALNHPNIAVIHEVDEQDGIDFIVMEFLEGRTLREEIGRAPLPVKEWLELVLPMAEGVAHAHRNGIIHRDLKPDNVMITGERQVKLLDFGLAKLREPERRTPSGVDTKLETISQEFTREGKVFGTVAYMSPEQARGEQTDHRSDLFSLGIVLYQLAGGRLPFKGRSTVETLHSIITADAQPLIEISGDIPPEADRIVRKLMEKEPDRRYQNAADLVADLRNLKRDVDTDRVPMVSGAPRPRWWLAASFVAIAAILVAGGIITYHRWFGPASIPEHLSESHTVGVIGFENLHDPADSDHISRMLVGLITTDLVESGGLEVVSMAKVLAAHKLVSEGAFETSIAPEVARKAGVQMMLAGQVDRFDEGFLLTAELVDVAHGTALGSFTKQAGSKSELFSLAGAIADEVRSRLRKLMQDSGSRAFDLASALTDSPKAYEYFAAGVPAFHEFLLDKAVESFEAAIRVDPTFAMAYYRLAAAFDWQGLSQKAVDAIGRGLPHISRLPQRWQVVYLAYHAYLTGNFEESHDMLAGLVDASTDIPDAYYYLGEITTHCSRYFDPRRSMVLFQETLEIDPSFRIALYHLVEDHIRAGEIDVAERLIEYHRQRQPDSEISAIAEVHLLSARGKLPEAIERGKELVARGTDVRWEVMATQLKAGEYGEAYEFASESIGIDEGYTLALDYGLRAQALIGLGRFREGLADADRIFDVIEVGQSLWGYFDRHAAGTRSDRTVMLAFTADTEAAIETARQGIEIDRFFPEIYFWLGRILIDAGRNKEAQEALESLRGMAREASSPVNDYWIHLLAAELSLAAGKPADALAQLEQAAAMPREYKTPIPEELVRARLHSAMGNPAGALAAYRAILQSHDYCVGAEVPPTVLRMIALYNVARLEEQTGDLEGARKHYREFLDHWGNADMPIPAVSDAKARLAALTGGGS